VTVTFLCRVPNDTRQSLCRVPDKKYSAKRLCRCTVRRAFFAECYTRQSLCRVYNSLCRVLRHTAKALIPVVTAVILLAVHSRRAESQHCPRRERAVFSRRRACDVRTYVPPGPVGDVHISVYGYRPYGTYVVMHALRSSRVDARSSRPDDSGSVCAVYIGFWSGRTRSIMALHFSTAKSNKRRSPRAASIDRGICTTIYHRGSMPTAYGGAPAGSLGPAATAEDEDHHLTVREGRKKRQYDIAQSPPDAARGFIGRTSLYVRTYA
jgi:hypothetical protein